jgi:hypothetical protein
MRKHHNDLVEECLVLPLLHEIGTAEIRIEFRQEGRKEGILVPSFDQRRPARRTEHL